jgi:rod shape determining protein RodA
MSTTFGRTDTLRRSGAFGGWDRFDYIMVFSAIGLVIFGLLLIYSGSRNVYEGPTFSIANPVMKQAMFAIVGIILMLVISRFDYHYLTHYWWVLYGGSIAVLIGVYLFGQTEFGATRWFEFGPIQLQPSEFAKIAVIVTMAHFFHQWGGDAKELKPFLLSLAIAMPVVGLVFIQPDLGTSLIFLSIWLGVVVVAGVSRNHLLVLGALCIAALPFAWAFVVEDYQVERISVLINPYEDRGGLGAGYNPIQAEIAVGSGGLTGKGLTNGEQTQLDYLKVPTRDFIFSVLAEEMGFVGAMGLFSLYVLVLMRGIRAAQIAGDAIGQLIAVGIVIMIMMQAFINIAVNLGIFPVTGLPLPFVSQGGSSLVSLFLALGVLQSIIMRHRAYRQF